VRRSRPAMRVARQRPAPPSLRGSPAASAALLRGRAPTDAALGPHPVGRAVAIEARQPGAGGAQSRSIDPPAPGVVPGEGAGIGRPLVRASTGVARWRSAPIGLIPARSVQPTAANEPAAVPNMLPAAPTEPIAVSTMPADVPTIPADVPTMPAGVPPVHAESDLIPAAAPGPAKALSRSLARPTALTDDGRRDRPSGRALARATGGTHQVDGFGQSMVVFPPPTRLGPGESNGSGGHIARVIDPGPTSNGNGPERTTSRGSETNTRDGAEFDELYDRILSRLRRDLIVERERRGDLAGAFFRQ
jgi:hypothetical protein